jgi:hypothetical protein
MLLAGAKNRNRAGQSPVHERRQGSIKNSVGFCTVDSLQLKMVSNIFPRLENNLLESFNLGANLPRSNIATTKSMLTSLLLLQIKGDSLIKY